MSLSRRDGKRIVSRADILTLIPSGEKGHPTSVRVEVDRGAVTLKSTGRRFFRKAKVNSKHSLKFVWVSDMTDDEAAGIKNCFVLITPEINYILQSDSHRSKIEWMRSLSIAISQSLKFRGSYKPSNWSNLDDLQKWLMTRELTYQFDTNHHYKGAEYSGKWTLGMPHIHGSLKWPNGNRYDGEFVHGKIEGSGTFMWFSHPTYRHYTGAWQDGKMDGHGEMLFLDHSSYVGWWRTGMRHGHGRMEYKSDNCSYVGGWEQDKRCGYGVYDNRNSEERYLGMWKNDKYNGAGILIASNKYHFSGDFVDGERNYDVSGSTRKMSRFIVQELKWDSLFKAMTSLLEQMVNTSHKRECSSSESTSEVFFSDKDSAVAMDEGEDECFFTDHNKEEMCGQSKAVPYPWCSALTVKDGELEGSCAVCKIEGFKSINHPFGLLVSHLSKCFVDSYSGIAVHASLLPHAVSEICSTTSRVHDLVRKYSPSLITKDENELLGKPRTQLSMLLKRSPYQRRKVSYKPPEHVDYSWLYPILLPAIFPTLFALYLEHYSQHDFKIDHVVSMLDDYSDEELSGVLQIRSFYEEWKMKGLPDFTFSNYLSGATEILKSFCDYHTPVNKLLCFQEVEQELEKLWISCQFSQGADLYIGNKSFISKSLLDMGKEVEEEEQREAESIKSYSTCSNSEMSEFKDDVSIDTLVENSSCSYEDRNTDNHNKIEHPEFPVGLLSFVIVRSRVQHLYSEIQFIQDFAGSTSLHQDYGSLLSKLKDTYYQLEDLSK